MALVAIGSSLVVLNLRDAPQQKLNQEADRLVAVLENAKAQARSRSTPLLWRADAQGFTLRSLPLQGPPLQTMTWLHPGTQVQPAEWVISAEPVQAAMQFQLSLHGGSFAPCRKRRAMEVACALALQTCRLGASRSSRCWWRWRFCPSA
jgi:hypothetical protein